MSFILGLITIETAVKIATVIKNVEIALEGVKIIADALIGVCKALELLNESIFPEDLGDKAIQATEKGIKPDSFDSYLDYVEAIENFEIDLEKSNTISEEDKYLKALDLSVGLIQSKIPGIDLDGFASLLSKFTPEKVSVILDSLHDGNCNRFNNMIGMVNHKNMERNEISDGIDGLVAVEKKINPELSDEDALTLAMQGIEDDEL